MARRMIAVVILVAAAACGTTLSGDLQEAVLARDASAVVRLLAAGADPNGRFRDGRSLIEVAVLKDANIAVLLLEAGADPETRIDGHDILLVVAANSDRCEPSILRALTTRGRGINDADPWGETPLHVALLTGADRCAEWLIRYGADVHAVTAYGDNMLHNAALGASAGLVQMLVDRGVQPNAVRQGSVTPLMYAAMRSASDEDADQIIELLLAHGADPCIVSRTGETLAELAAHQGASQRADRLNQACSRFKAGLE